LDRGDLADKLAMSERVARTWPANAVVVRRAVFLAFDGKAESTCAARARPANLSQRATTRFRS
jgi:hypothetical protein